MGTSYCLLISGR
jgi:hypothetical protein